MEITLATHQNHARALEPVRTRSKFSSVLRTPAATAAHHFVDIIITSRAKWHVSVVLHSSSSWRHRCILGLLPWERQEVQHMVPNEMLHPPNTFAAIVTPVAFATKGWATVARRSSFATDQRKLEDGKGKSVHIQVASSFS